MLTAEFMLSITTESFVGQQFRSHHNAACLAFRTAPKEISRSAATFGPGMRSTAVRQKGLPGCFSELGPQQLQGSVQQGVSLGRGFGLRRLLKEQRQLAEGRLKIGTANRRLLAALRKCSRTVFRTMVHSQPRQPSCCFLRRKLPTSWYVATSTPCTTSAMIR